MRLPSNLHSTARRGRISLTGDELAGMFCRNEQELADVAHAKPLHFHSKTNHYVKNETFHPRHRRMRKFDLRVAGFASILDLI